MASAWRAKIFAKIEWKDTSKNPCPSVGWAIQKNLTDTLYSSAVKSIGKILILQPTEGQQKPARRYKPHYATLEHFGKQDRLTRAN